MNPVDRIIHYRLRQPKTGHSWEFFNVTFITDFGPWKKDEHFSNMIFDLNSGQITCFDLVTVEEEGRTANVKQRLKSIRFDICEVANAKKEPSTREEKDATTPTNESVSDKTNLPTNPPVV